VLQQPVCACAPLLEPAQSGRLPQQFPRKMARGTVQAFIDYLEGKELKKNNFIPCAHYYYEDSIGDSSRVREQW